MVAAPSDPLGPSQPPRSVHPGQAVSMAVTVPGSHFLLSSAPWVFPEQSWASAVAASSPGMVGPVAWLKSASQGQPGGCGLPRGVWHPQ